MNGRALIGVMLVALTGAAMAQEPPVAIAPFSAAAPGAALPAPWQHQPLPKVERENRYTLVEDMPDGRARTVLTPPVAEGMKAPVLPTTGFTISRASNRMP